MDNLEQLADSHVAFPDRFPVRVCLVLGYRYFPFARHTSLVLRTRTE